MKPDSDHATSTIPWNKGRLIGQKAALKLKEIWAIRIRLQLAEKIRDLALFNLAIDSKLRGCDLVNLRVCDIAKARAFSSEPWSCSARRTVRCSSRLPSRRASQWQLGSMMRIRPQPIPVPQQGGKITASVDPPVRTHCNDLGWSPLVSIRQPMGPTQCGVPRRH
jgi:hypothetical protein